MDDFDFKNIPKRFTEDEENLPPISAGKLSNFKSSLNYSSLHSSQTNSNRCDDHGDKHSRRFASSEIPKPSAVRQLSSTLKSSHSGNLFQPNVSEIPQTSQRLEKDVSINMSKNNNNESSTFSTSKCNNLFGDFNMDESTRTIAQKYIKDKNSPRPKNPEVFQKYSNTLRTQAARNSAAVKPSNNQPSIEALVEKNSVLSRPSTPSNRQEIALKPFPVSHYGFVAINEEVQSKVFVRNQTTEVLEITPIINDSSGSFRLISNETVQIEPNCAEEFGVIFSPKEIKRYQKKIEFYIGSSGNHYSHTLFGYGGTGDVKIVENRIKFFPRNSVYRCSPSDPKHFTFEVENFGNRSTFVHVTPLDDLENETRTITVTPESFCLMGKSDNDLNAPTKQKITVNVSESYMQQMNRISLDSVDSASSGSATKSRLLTIKVYFGVERLRQRATRYSEEINGHQTYRGLLLTKTPFLLNGKPITTSDRDPVSNQDIEMLKAQTHVLTLVVGDDRIANLSLPSRSASSFSHHSSEDGYYFPNKNTANETMISNISKYDRTFY